MKRPLGDGFVPATIVPTDLDKAWAAGIIDGEGSILVVPQPAYSSRQNWRLEVAVTNSDLRMLFRLKERWGGGKIHEHNRRKERPVHWKPTWDWRLGGRSCAPFLTDILPYLVCKREQAEIGLLFIATTVGRGFGNRLSDTSLEERRHMYESIKELNNVLRPDPVSFGLGRGK